jgi:2-polyprenyl-3-methyl-5-hydroxy-6-metoxy-1,4-benzoquinol methylase
MREKMTKNEEGLDWNKKRWNELVDIHFKSKFYDVQGFLGGKSSLDEIELEGLGDVKGKKVLHLQCHFGMTTLSIARLGAKVTGVDFCENAVDKARELSAQSGIKANFMCSNVLELDGKLDGQFDIIFTSYGILCWLPDLAKWAQTISTHLKDDGIFFIAEYHPFMCVFSDQSTKDCMVTEFPYFRAEYPYCFDANATYTDGEYIIEYNKSYEWPCSLADVIQSLIDAGLKIKEFKEYPFCNFQFLKNSTNHEGKWWIEGLENKVPAMFSILATK